MERCTGNTGELQSQLAVVLPARWPLSCPWLPCPGLTTALRAQTVLSYHGSEYPRGQGLRGGLGGVGSLDEDGEAILGLSCGHPHLALARQEHRFVWRRRLVQSGRAVVSPRDVKLAPRSRRGRVKMLDVAIRVTATYPAKWLLAPVEGRHTSSAR